MAEYVRMQMLYRPDQREALQRYARQNKVSVTEAARRALDIGLKELEQEDEFVRLGRVLEEIKEFHKEILARNGGKPLDINPPEDLRQMREERLEHICGNL